MDILAEQVQKKSQKDLATRLTGILDETPPFMWKEISSIFDKEKVFSSGEINRFLREFECEGREANARLENQDKLTYKALHAVLEEKVKNLDLLMLTRFKQIFELAPNGVPRQWTDAVEVDVEWQNAKLEAEKLVDLFSIIRIQEEFMDVHIFEPNSLESGVVQLTTIPNLPDDVQLMSPSEGNRLLLRFRDQAQISYSAAIKERDRAQNGSRIPTYMVIILLVLGWNEIMWVLSWIFFSPITFSLSFIIIMVGYALWRANAWAVVKAVGAPIMKEAQSYLNFRIEEWNRQTTTNRPPNPEYTSLRSSSTNVPKEAEKSSDKSLRQSSDSSLRHSSDKHKTD